MSDTRWTISPDQAAATISIQGATITLRQFVPTMPGRWVFETDQPEITGPTRQLSCASTESVEKACMVARHDMLLYLVRIYNDIAAIKQVRDHP